jgi:hypothetical protein
MESFEGHFQGGSRKTIPKKKNGPTWMSQDMLRIMEIRRQVKTEGNWAKEEN